MIKDTSLINKAGDWKSEYGNVMTERNPINNVTTLTYSDHGIMGILGTFDSFNVIKEFPSWVPSYHVKLNDAQKSWKQGEVDAEGYFKLTHLTSQKILTAIFPNKLILVDKGKSYILQGFSY